jgi:hypothetical protein
MRKLMTAICLGVLGFVLPAPLEARNADAPWTAYDDANAKLAAAYDAVMASLSPPNRIAMRNTERAWIAARNRSCGFETKNSCAVTWTKRRAAELESGLSRSTGFRTLPISELFKLERRMDDACRSPGQDAFGPVCTHSERVTKELYRRGWCFGPDGETSADERWMRAGPNCHPSL